MEYKDFEPSIIQDNDNNIYINISKAFSSSLVERADESIALNSFVPIKDIAEAKGLTSTRAIRLKLNDPECGYISREVKVNGGTSYEILYSSLEPEIQRILCRANVSVSERSPEVAKSKVNDNDSEENDCFLWNKIQDDLLRKGENKSTALVPLNYQCLNVLSGLKQQIVDDVLSQKTHKEKIKRLIRITYISLLYEKEIVNKMSNLPLQYNTLKYHYLTQYLSAIEYHLSYSFKEPNEKADKYFRDDFHICYMKDLDILLTCFVFSFRGSKDTVKLTTYVSFPKCTLHSISELMIPLF